MVLPGERFDGEDGVTVCMADAVWVMVKFVMVVVAGAEVCPAPEAVALFVTLAAVRSAWVMV
jgi:hypothetical protein